MLENYLNFLKKKIIKGHFLYLPFVIFGIVVSIIERNVFAYGILFVFVVFYLSFFARYFGYYRWVKYNCQDGVAIINFKSQPNLFFRKFHKFKLPLKSFAMPLNTKIEYTLLNGLSVIDGVLFEQTSGEYDFGVSINNETFTKLISSK